MDARGMQGYLTWGVLFLLEVLVVGRILLRSHRDPSSRIAWITVVVALPVVGIAAYLLSGETNLGRRIQSQPSRCRRSSR